jgi:asparagine synthase (glutamine-hydrolysing)
MCGWAGCWVRGGQAAAELAARVGGMADTLRHRGPDDAGVWVDARAGLGLGFRRLAVVDLSSAGHQPMRSPSGRYVIAFNGEIYNFRQLRQELEPLGHRFAGHSDTEVMLAAVEQWGLAAAVRRFVGMFAFAVWDGKEQGLALVRDRLGIKPLYYGWAGETFLFGSELKALCAHPAFRAEVDREALTLFIRYSYIPPPYCIYRGFHQLAPGCVLTVGPSGPDRPAPAPYWSAKQVAEQGVARPFTGSAAEAVRGLDGLLREAVKLRMTADVPLGAFLSGGVDSSTVVALMQAQSTRQVKTFSIGLQDARYNEAVHARAVAAHLGTAHTELYVSSDAARTVIPRLPEIYDEPFSDPSQIPSFLVSQLARTAVTVSLSGDGGDELFGGYVRYFRGKRIWDTMKLLPAWMRRRIGRALGSVKPAAYDRSLGWLSALVAGIGGQGSVGDKIGKLAEALRAPGPEAIYARLLSYWPDPARLVVGGREPSTILAEPTCWPNGCKFMERMMYFDLVGYLPGDILTKVDRATMAVGLEARVPFLDHRLVEFAWRLPLSLRVRDGRGKWLLRQVLYSYVPRHLIDRPKMGFGIPLDSWLRGPLRPWAEDLLDERRLRHDGFLTPAPIRARWAEHLAGVRNWSSCLWGVLMFQAWLDRWGRSAGRGAESSTCAGARPGPAPIDEREGPARPGAPRQR